jgi:hypothetical protein
MVGRELEPEQVVWDLMDSRPVSKGVQVTDGWTVLDPADLCLSESEPDAEQLLGDAVAPIEFRKFAMSAVGADDATDVLGGERVAAVLRCPGLGSRDRTCHRDERPRRLLRLREVGALLDAMALHGGRRACDHLLCRLGSP